MESFLLFSKCYSLDQMQLYLVNNLVTNKIYYKTKLQVQLYGQILDHCMGER